MSEGSHRAQQLFKYDGVIPASKSYFNRALLCASYKSPKDALHLDGTSLCDDVQKMQQALAHLGGPSAYDCGSAGTVLRFLALRLSRIPGQHILTGTPRLLSRPQEELKNILAQLGVELVQSSDHLIIRGNGWNLKNPPLHVNREKSSQFASAVLLNSWDLAFPLRLDWSHPGVSQGYWQMSVQLVKNFGMNFLEEENSIQIFPHSKVKIQQYEVESDLSSAFAIAAYAVLNGEATFRRFPFHSLQPDLVFLQILEKMGVGIERHPNQVRIFRRTNELGSLKGVHWNLSSCPDLFPVLATLCGFANGPSRLDGAPHLVFKESNRIQKTAELLQHMGVQTRILPDGMEILPPKKLTVPQQAFDYDSDEDHRLAFAAALLASQQYPIRILHPEVVNKSFPEFWQILINNSVNL